MTQVTRVTWVPIVTKGDLGDQDYLGDQDLQGELGDQSD